jgi:hypothetical protein
MSNEFDASQLWSEPVPEETLAAQRRTVADLMQRPNALTNAKLHAERELERLVMVCNRLAWGAIPAERRAPDAGEVEALLAQLDEEKRGKLLADASRAAEQRLLVSAMQQAELHCIAQLQAEQAQFAAHEAEQQEWAEFEAFDAAGKAERFAAWRAARMGQG